MLATIQGGLVVVVAEVAAASTLRGVCGEPMAPVVAHVVALANKSAAEVAPGMDNPLMANAKVRLQVQGHARRRLVQTGSFGGDLVHARAHADNLERNIEEEYVGVITINPQILAQGHRKAVEDVPSLRVQIGSYGEHSALVTDSVDSSEHK